MDEEMTDGEMDAEDEEDTAVWQVLTPEQKKQFKKLTEKTEKNMNYIG